MIEHVQEENIEGKYYRLISKKGIKENIKDEYWR